MEICKVWKTSTGAKLVTVPAKSKIKAGDYVKILPILEEKVEKEEENKEVV